MNQYSYIKPEVRLSVLAFCETVFRQGGLTANSFKADAKEGIKLHRLYVEAMREKYASRVLAEKQLQGSFATETATMILKGRYDLLVLGHAHNHDLIDTKNNVTDETADRYSTQLDTMIELKTHALKAHELPPEGDSLHWSQLMIYGWLYLRATKAAAIQLELVYLSRIDKSRLFWRKQLSLAELENFFDAAFASYMQITGNWINFQNLRTESARAISFPYQDIRPGQKELMQTVLTAIKQKESLFVQAPTGIGKTISTVFPAVRALGHQLVDYVFYLTAMTSTRRVVVDTIKDLREVGLHIRSIVITAKEKLCLEPSIYCDTKICPYATSYYQNLPEALVYLFSFEDINQELILSAAQKYSVCPFELSLDIALYCDFIICDYNYVFDPRIQLERFFSEQHQKNCLLLVDEAHNLPARSRQMYSASLSEKQVKAALLLLEKLLSTSSRRELQLLQNSLNQIKAWLDSVKIILSQQEQEQSGFEVVEEDCASHETMHAPAFMAMRNEPINLVKHCARARFFISSALDDLSESSVQTMLRELMFELGFFVKVADMFVAGHHITSAKLEYDKEQQNSYLLVSLMCLDASSFIGEQYLLRFPTVFFSATLTPVSYYVGLLNGQAKEHPPAQLLLPSPFPFENFLLLVNSAISLKYKKREETMAALLELVLATIRQKTGNYLLFVPSYAYLRRFRRLLKEAKPTDIDCLTQIPAMDESLKRKFLDRFNHFGQKTLLAVAVMGSFFNEGIDLTGDKLSGVIIAGTGIPKLSPEREILRQYYEEKMGNGYAYSYIYPGFNRIQQAAGRVIRSENDRGFVLLIDDRYDNYEYRQLFPPEWRPLYLKETAEICLALQAFWQEG